MKLKRIQVLLYAHKAEMKKKYHVKGLAIFGSYARGEQKTGSDVDVLVKFNSKASLFNLVELGEYLEELLQTKVDLVSEGALRKELKDSILQEAISV